jgi:hypothetical protein
MSDPNPNPTLLHVRFSNANTTTDAYRLGAKPAFPQTPLDAAGRVDTVDGCERAVGVVVTGSEVLVVVAGAREAEGAEELHAEATTMTRADAMPRRTARASLPLHPFMREHSCAATALELLGRIHRTRTDSRIACGCGEHRSAGMMLIVLVGVC